MRVLGVGGGIVLVGSDYLVTIGLHGILYSRIEICLGDECILDKFSVGSVGGTGCTI